MAGNNLNQWRVICPTCNGTGKVKGLVFLSPGGWKTMELPCMNCQCKKAWR